MSPIDTDASAAEGPEANEPKMIVARAGRYYRNARYLMALICIACGLWFAYDGWKAWPAENAAARARKDRKEEKLPHGEELDIPIQKLLGFVLPVAGIGLLVRMFRKSRGEYRLEDDILYVPGHPPVPLTSILQIDKTRWDRKGIARLEYEVAGGASPAEWLTLDDFVYDQKPTDAIMARIEAVLVPPEDGDAEGGTDVANASETEARDEASDTDA